jgi:hypothetical protein
MTSIGPERGSPSRHRTATGADSEEPGRSPRPVRRARPQPSGHARAS